MSDLEERLHLCPSADVRQMESLLVEAAARIHELEAALKRARQALAMQPLPTTFNEVENKRAELAAIDSILNRSTTDAAE